MAKTIIGIFIGTIIATLLMGIVYCGYTAIIWLWDECKRKIDPKDLDERRRAIWLHLNRVK